MALSKNYRITRDAIDLLELIGEYEVFEVAKIATGMSATLRAIDQKKIVGQPFLSVGAS